MNEAAIIKAQILLYFRASLHSLQFNTKFFCLVSFLLCYYYHNEPAGIVKYFFSPAVLN